MDLLPAIDLRQGRVARLRQGDARRATFYAGDPAAVAAAYARAGARRIHVVDLDAAFGEAPQHDLLVRILEAVAQAAGAGAAAAGVGVQLGGGLRDRAAVERALAAGCERVVLGSLPVRQPQRFAELAHAFSGRLVPAVETRGDEVRIAGWTDVASRTLAELCAHLRGLPCPAVLVTDIERDGMLTGPNLPLARRIAGATGLPALLSGGVRTLADLAAAAACPDIAGVILGRALYEHELALGDALAVCAAGCPAPAAEAGRP